MSSLIFAFAAIVTHSLFRTDFKNIHINNASSYFDLSPLYGDSKSLIYPHTGAIVADDRCHF